MKYKEHNQLRYPIMTKQILALSEKNTVKRRQNILFMRYFFIYTVIIVICQMRNKRIDLRTLQV